MDHMSRRQFLQHNAALLGALVPASLGAQGKRDKLPVAAVITEYRTNSHADVIVGKILQGFQQDGGAGPDLRLVALFTDQVPKTDLSRDLAMKHGFRIARTVEEAITLGGDKLAVAGVLSIGEHGTYPYTKDTNQHMYPRRRFFDDIVAVFRKYKKVVPLFSDKHLAYAWRDAKHMYDTARAMNIPFIAGSSLPVAWRAPALTLPKGCRLTEALGVGYGGLESYGFHALEALQCMVERRRGGETGVAAIQAARGPDIAQALKDKRWSQDLLDAAVAAIPPPPKGRPKDIAKDAVFFLLEYRDGLKAAVAMNTRLANEFAFAGRIQEQARIQATCVRLQNGKPYGHFAYLLRAIDHTIHTGKPAYPVERTLLTTGVLDALMHSAAQGGRLIKTPELNITYEPADWPFAPGMVPA